MKPHFSSDSVILPATIVLMCVACRSLSNSLPSSNLEEYPTHLLCLEEFDLSNNSISIGVDLSSMANQSLFGHLTQTFKEVYWDWPLDDWNAWVGAVGFIPFLEEFNKSPKSDNRIPDLHYRQVLKYKHIDKLYAVTNWSNCSMTDNQFSLKQDMFSSIASALLILVPSINRTEGVNLVGGGDQFSTFKVIIDYNVCGGVQFHMETKNLDLPFNREDLLVRLFEKPSSFLNMDRIKNRAEDLSSTVGDYCSFSTLTSSIEYACFSSNQIGVLEYRDRFSGGDYSEGMRILWEPATDLLDELLVLNSKRRADDTFIRSNSCPLSVDGFRMSSFRDGKRVSIETPNLDEEYEGHFNAIEFGRVVLDRIACSIPYGDNLYTYPNVKGFDNIHNTNINLAYFESNWGSDEHSRRVVDIWGNSESFLQKLPCFFLLNPYDVYSRFSRFSKDGNTKE